MKRKDRTGEHILYHELYKQWIDEHPGEEVPEYFVSANDLTPLEHVKVQAKIQEYTDSSISKTVNAPNEHTVDDVKDLYMSAYDLGLKGVTYFRDGAREGVLEHLPKEGEKKLEVPAEAATAAPLPTPRPKVLDGKTVRVETAYGKMYVTLNTDADGNLIEVFATLGKAGGLGASLTEAITRLISTSLRAGVAPRKIISELRGITDQPFGFGDNRVTSVADAIGKTMEDYLYPKLDLPEVAQAETTAPLTPADQAAQIDAAAAVKAAEAPDLVAMDEPAGKLAGICPDCGGPLEFASGCKICHSCGYSACG
jgi:ribonucleoside-diphosphate reductase alpha chain